MKRTRRLAFLWLYSLLFLCFSLPVRGQMITGTWRGKINRQKAEIKIIQKGDSLTGTSYYYESANNYRRYSIKGYFDKATNAAVWWDDQLLAEQSGRLSIFSPGKIPLLARTDFNCPGDGRMMLDGKAAKRDDDMDIKGDVHLDKTSFSEFEDEWDFVIENYTSGANDPRIIDSIGAVALVPVPFENSQPGSAEENIVVLIAPAPPKPVEKTTEPVIEKPKPVERTAAPVKAPTIEEKFTARQKVFIKEIPVSGDSIELRFYDNAEIDGDSISLFLNDKLLFQHIRLTGNAHIIKIAVSELKDSNELTMVAENLGAIPPNTSYMVAIVNGVRYDAYLASSEGSSAMIRLVKKQAH
ncbi:MAG: hypothetical protein ACT4OJ_14735 [Bacteroidota bacterium]